MIALGTSKESYVAKKYAQAYMNVQGNLLTLPDYEAIKKASNGLLKNKRLIFFWRLSSIEPVIKALSIEQVSKKYNLPASIKKLCHFLLEHNRLFLIPLVLEKIGYLYEQLHNIEVFNIMSAQQLNEKELATLHHFLSQHLAKNVLYTQVVEPKLIAGIRMQSNNFLWQHSIATNIRRARLSLLR